MEEGREVESIFCKNQKNRKENYCLATQFLNSFLKCYFFNKKINVEARGKKKLWPSGKFFLIKVFVLGPCINIVLA